MWAFGPGLPVGLMGQIVLPLVFIQYQRSLTVHLGSRTFCRDELKLIQISLWRMFWPWALVTVQRRSGRSVNWKQTTVQNKEGFCFVFSKQLFEYDLLFVTDFLPVSLCVRLCTRLCICTFVYMCKCTLWWKCMFVCMWWHTCAVFVCASACVGVLVRLHIRPVCFWPPQYFSTALCWQPFCFHFIVFSVCWHVVKLCVTFNL